MTNQPTTQLVKISEEQREWLKSVVEGDLERANDMIQRANEVNCIEASKWAEGYRDATEHYKAVMQVMGISFQ